MAIYDPIVDLFSQDQVKAPKIDPNASALGGSNMNGDWAYNTELALRHQGEAAQGERAAAAQGQAAQGQAAIAQGNRRAATSQGMGTAGLIGGQMRGATADATGASMAANAAGQAGNLQGQAAAVQQRQAPQVDLGGANRSAATGTQAQGSLLGNANRLGAAAGANQAQTSTAGALGRNAAGLTAMAGPNAGQQANIGALGAAAKTPEAQTANANALGAAGQTTGAQQGNAAALRNFYTQGPGPSVAEAQLRQGAEQAMASNLSLARSGRGGANAGAERQALFANAAQQAQTNQGAAILRAQETDAFRNRQLQAMGLETGALGTARGQDIQGLTAQTNALGQARGQDIQALGLQGQMLGQARSQDIGAMSAATNALAQQGQVQTAARGQDIGALQGQTAALGQAGALANQQQQIGAQTALGVSGQQLQNSAQNDAAAIQREALAQQAIASGNQNQLAALGIGNQAIGQGQNFALGMGGLANQSVATGQQANAALQGLSNQAAGQGYQTDMGYQGMGLQTVTNQANLNMNLEALKSGQALQAGMANAGYDQARDAAGLGMAVGGLGYLGMAGSGLLSDVHTKEDFGPPGDDDPYGLAGGGMRRGSGDGGMAPYSAIVDQNKGYQAQLAATQANMNAQKGAEAQAAAPKSGGGGLNAGQMAALGLMRDSVNTKPEIPTYVAPQFQPVNANYVTSDEAAKEQAFKDGAANARINIVNGLNTYEGRGQLPVYLNYLRGQGMEDMRKGGVQSEQVEPAPKKEGAEKKPAKPKTDKAAALGVGEGTDLRAASNSTWQYKDPSMPGAVPGRQIGPMAQDLLKTDAAPLVRQQPNGYLGVDGARAGMVALGALGEQQRRQDELERRMAALGVRSAA